MSKYSLFDEHKNELKKAISEFYKKYDLKPVDVNGKANDPFMNYLEQFDSDLSKDLFDSSIYEKSQNNKNDVYPESLQSAEYDNFVTKHLKAYYNIILKDLISLKVKNVLEPINIFEYEQKDVDKDFVSDFSTIMSQVFKDSYLPKFSPEKQENLPFQNNADEYFFQPTRESAYNVKSQINAATDRKMYLIKGSRYNDNRHIMNVLNASTKTSADVKNPQVGDNMKRPDYANDLLADYLVLKEQYSKRGTFSKIFMSFGTRRALAKAEKEMERLSRFGVFELSRDSKGNVDYVKTAINNVGDSRFMNNIADGAKEDYCKKTNFYEKHSVPSKEELEQEAKVRNDTLYNEYYKGINQYIENKNDFTKLYGNSPANFINPNEDDLKIYNKALNELIANTKKESSNLINANVKDYQKAVKHAMLDNNLVEKDYKEFKKIFANAFNGFNKDHDFNKLKEYETKLDKLVSDKGLKVKVSDYIKIDEIANKENTRLNKLNKHPLAKNNDQKNLEENLEKDFDNLDINKEIEQRINGNENVININLENDGISLGDKK